MTDFIVIYCIIAAFVTLAGLILFTLEHASQCNEPDDLRRYARIMLFGWAWPILAGALAVEAAAYAFGKKGRDE